MASLMWRVCRLRYITTTDTTWVDALINSVTPPLQYQTNGDDHRMIAQQPPSQDAALISQRPSVPPQSNDNNAAVSSRRSSVATTKSLMTASAAPSVALGDSHTSAMYLQQQRQQHYSASEAATDSVVRLVNAWAFLINYSSRLRPIMLRSSRRPTPCRRPTSFARR